MGKSHQYPRFASTEPTSTTTTSSTTTSSPFSSTSTSSSSPFSSTTATTSSSSPFSSSSKQHQHQQQQPGFIPITPSPLSPPSLPARLFSSFAKTPIGQGLYTLLIGLLASLGLSIRFLANPRKFLAPVSRDHLAAALHAPALGEHVYLKSGGAGAGEKGDVMIHAVCLGPEHGPLLVMVHGFPQFWYSWRAEMAHFAAQGYRCVAVDLRGYGDSGRPAGVGQYDLRYLAGDVEAVIKGLGYSRAAAVVAHDWGAIVAYAFAARYPASLDRLIIMNGPHPVAFTKQIYTFPQIIKSCYVFFFQLPVLPELVFSHADWMLLNTVFTGHSGRQVVSREDLELYKYSLSKPGAITAAINYYRALMQGSLRWVGKIQARTLVVWGVNDEFLNPAINAELASYIEDYQLKSIPNCSHWTAAERPAEVHALMGEFLQS